MLLAHVNVRSELHGEEREPASDLKFEVTLPNEVLSQLDPGLKSALYHYDNARDDLSDKGQKEPGFLPHLRFPKLNGAVLKWSDEMQNANIAILVPGAKSATDLEDVKVNNVSFTPKDGGSIALSFRVQCKPDEKKFGKLATLVQSDVEITLSGPAA